MLIGFADAVSFFGARSAAATAPQCVRLLRGDLAQSDADALAVSANPALEGIARSNHWRFNGRKNADGAVRTAGGRSLAAATASLQRRVGALQPSSAAVSDAGRSLRARWIVHCVAPDAVSRTEAEQTAFLNDPASYERALDARLEATYAAAISAASSAGARSLALPAIGCGVKSFPRERAGSAAFRAAAAWLHGPPSDRLRRVDFVVFADAVWAAWPACARDALGPPAEACDARQEADARGRGEVFTWVSVLPRESAG